MAKIQKYNSRNKCYVLMECGQIIANRKDKFEGVPVYDEMELEPEPEPEIENEPVERVDSKETTENPWAWY